MLVNNRMVFSNLFKFEHKHSWKEAVGFYIFYSFPSMLIFVLFFYLGFYLPSVVLPVYTAFIVLISMLLKLIPAILTYIILNEKKLLDNYISYLYLILAVALGFLGGIFVGMILAAYLTTRTPHIFEKQKVSKPALSLKAILLGTLVNVIPSDIISLVFIGILVHRAGIQTTSVYAVQEVTFNYESVHPILYQIINIPGALFSVLGGFVAAKIAGRYELLNATLTSWWCVLGGVLEIFLLGSVQPFWFTILIVILNILLATLGGLIYLRVPR